VYWCSRIFLLRIVIIKGLTARRLLKSFGVKGLGTNMALASNLLISTEYSRYILFLCVNYFIVSNMLHNKTNFCGKELLAPRPTHKSGRLPLLGSPPMLIHIFAASLRTGDLSSTHNPRTSHSEVTGTHFIMGFVRV
jgi:hypothetical protein